MTGASWTYFNPVRVVFGRGSSSRLPELVGESRVALVTTRGFRRRGATTAIEEGFGARLAAVIDDVKPNPDVSDVESQAARLHEGGPEVLVAFGGGSTIDTAKALAALLAAQPGTRLAALLRGEARADAPALPVVGVPTTAGTGSEVTPFATVWDHHEKKKHSLAGDDLFPKLAVLDPDLTLGLPAELTIASGLDAVSHALESTWNRNATPASLALARQSLELSIRALPAVNAEPGNVEARAAMLQASLLAGMAISQSRTALAHAISYPLTASFDLPHGLACSFTLPALLAFNAAADDGRLAQLARVLGHSSPEELARALSRMFTDLGVGALVRSYLPDRSSVAALADRMFAPGRAENNLRPASLDDVRNLVADALGALGV
jgi:alcohol dehydrogenase